MREEVLGTVEDPERVLAGLAGELLALGAIEVGKVRVVNFRKPADATDSELSDDDVIVRYGGDEVVGYTILHASKR